MAFSYINSAESNVGWVDTITVNKPTNTSSWDIMFSIINHFAASTSNPDWWTKLWTWYFSTELWYKVAWGSEPSNYTWWFAWANNTRWAIFTFRWWFDTIDPIDVVSNTNYNWKDQLAKAISMNVSNTNSPLIFLAMASKTSSMTFTKPTIPNTNWTENYDWWSTLSDYWNEVCSMTWSWSWATWDMSATMLTSTVSKHAFAVALNPAVDTNSWFLSLF